MTDRTTFSDFLDRLADGRTGPLEWQRLVVAHYADAFLEEMRRCTLRLMQDRLPYHGNSETGRDALRCWAMALRSSAAAAPADEVVIGVTPHEAVALDEFLRRYSATGKLGVEHPAEQRMLWNIECVIEKHGDRPLWPSLDQSRAALSDED